MIRVQRRRRSSINERERERERESERGGFAMFGVGGFL